MKEFLSDCWDEFGLEAIIVIVLASILIMAYYGKMVEEKECKKNGGVVIEHSFSGSQCLTKEDIKKLRGE